MAYTNLNFVPGEILTAAKMNLLAANDASFRDGTGILDNSIQLSKIKNTYSTTEEVVGKWVDDKTIYRRVWVFSNTNSINLGVRIHNIIRQSMIVRSSQDSHLRPIPWLYGNGNAVDGKWYAGYYITAPSSGNSYCQMQFGSDVNRVAGGHLILEYTKP